MIGRGKKPPSPQQQAEKWACNGVSSRHAGSSRAFSSPRGLRGGGIYGCTCPRPSPQEASPHSFDSSLILQ